MSDKPIVITMGDPSGVGAEVTVKAMAGLSPAERARYAVIGDEDTLQRAIRACDLGLALRPQGSGPEAALQVIHVPVDGLRAPSACCRRPAARLRSNTSTRRSS